jgi:hypothetical protein
MAGGNNLPVIPCVKYSGAPLSPVRIGIAMTRTDGVNRDRSLSGGLSLGHPYLLLHSASKPLRTALPSFQLRWNRSIFNQSNSQYHCRIRHDGSSQECACHCGIISLLLSCSDYSLSKSMDTVLYSKDSGRGGLFYHVCDGRHSPVPIKRIYRSLRTGELYCTDNPHRRGRSLRNGHGKPPRHLAKESDNTNDTSTSTTLTVQP